MQDGATTVQPCKCPRRLQVLAGRRQGQQLDLLGSFPSDSGYFQHVCSPHPPPPPPPSTAQSEQGATQGTGEGAEEERGGL